MSRDDGPTTLYLGNKRLAEAFHTERRWLAHKTGEDLGNTEMFEFLLAFMKDRGRAEFAEFAREYALRQRSARGGERPPRSRSGDSHEE